MPSSFISVLRWLRAVFQRPRLDREMRDELRHHLDRATERLTARGLSPADARLAARRELGNVPLIEAQGRDARGAEWVESLRADIRYALRTLRRSPAFTTVAILSLAIGIGANTTIFSLIDAVILQPLPVERPRELVRLSITDSTATGLGGDVFTNPQWEQIRDRARGFAGFATSRDMAFNLATSGEARYVMGGWVNGDFFTTLGVRPALGRLFTTSDDVHGCPATAVVSHSFWQSELGGRSNVVGTTLMLREKTYTIIGVAPAGFFGVDVGLERQIYLPLCQSNGLDARTLGVLRIIGRPARGLSIVQTNARLRNVGRAVFESTIPEQDDTKRQAEYVSSVVVARPDAGGFSAVRARYAPALLALMGMVGIVLLITCANVANLLLARGAARSREMAIRIAIGASRTRLIRQFLIESALLAVVGAVIGIALSQWGSRALVDTLGDQSSSFRVALDLSLDLRVLLFTAAVGIATVFLFGLAPAWRATNVDPQSAMKGGGRGTSDGSTRFRLGKALVVLQCALALVLVVGAGLLVGTLRHLTTLDLGFQPDGVLVADATLNQPHATGVESAALLRQMLEQLRGIPGVRGASLSQMIPLAGASWSGYLDVDGFTSAKDDDHLAFFNYVSDGFFATMGTTLVAGRDFTRADNLDSAAIAIVNRAMVNRFLHGASPLGRTYQTENDGKRSAPVTIVGVVEDSKYENLREEPQPLVYLPASLGDHGTDNPMFEIRTTGPPRALIGAVKAVAGRADPAMSFQFLTLSELVGESLQRERLLAMLSGFFGALALALAVIGLYGVMAYTVARRRVEMGIRIALGAQRSRVMRLVLGDVGRLVAIGTVIGGVTALAGTRVLSRFLFGVTATDPLTVTCAAATLAAAAFMAGAIPARRAARLEPMEALREE